MKDLRINKFVPVREILFSLKNNGYIIPDDFDKKYGSIELIDGFIILKKNKNNEEIHICLEDMSAEFIILNRSKQISEDEINKPEHINVDVSYVNEWLSLERNKEKSFDKEIIDVLDTKEKSIKTDSKPYFTSEYLVVGRGASGRAGIDDIDPEDIHDRITTGG